VVIVAMVRDAAIGVTQGVTGGTEPVTRLLYRGGLHDRDALL